MSGERRTRGASGERSLDGNAAAKPPRGRNARQQDQRQETRRLLVSAAVRVFEVRGYVETSVEHVLVEARVSRAAFYSHFDGKLALVCAVAEDFRPEWSGIFDALAELREPSLEHLERWAERHLAFHATHQAICSLLSQVALLEDRLYWIIAEQRDRLIAALAERFPAFQKAMDDPAARLRAQLLLWNIDQTCFMVVRGRLPDPAHCAGRQIAQQMRAFLVDFE
jgi:AcrR family transcriptional regulator